MIDAQHNTVRGDMRIEIHQHFGQAGVASSPLRHQLPPMNPIHSLEEVDRRKHLEAMICKHPIFMEQESLFIQARIPASANNNTNGSNIDIFISLVVNALKKKLWPVRLNIKVIANGFKIHGSAEKALRVPPDRDSKMLRFLLECETDQLTDIQIEVYSKKNYLDTMHLQVAPIKALWPKEQIWKRELIRDTLEL